MDNKLSALQAILDEMKLESRKIEYSSALERLTKRVEKVEEDIDIIKKCLLAIEKRL